MNDTIAQSPGCVIFLIDESAAAAAPVQEEADPAGAPAKSKSASIATALNSLFRQFAGGPDFDVALVGYHADANGQANVGCRWQGPLAGRGFVPVSELADAPASVESRVRRVPNPSGIGAPREETISFPVWYVPAPGTKSPQVQAFEFCRTLLENWLDQAGPQPGVPLVVHLCAGGSSDGNPQKAIEEIQHLEFATGAPLVLHAHLSTSKVVPPTLYPSNRAYLPLGPIRELFERSSLLPLPLVQALKAGQAPVNKDARGMLYNARMIDVVQFLSLVKSHAKTWPARRSAAELESVRAGAEFESTAEASTDSVLEEAQAAGASSGAAIRGDVEAREKIGLIVLVLDRSVDDPFVPNPDNVCHRLQEDANALLAKIAKKGNGRIDVGVVSYGRDTLGEDEVRTTFDGPLAGQSLVRDSELGAGALRVEEFEEKVPNGVGGLITVPIKRHVFLELEPTAAGSPVPALAAARDLAARWCADHPRAAAAPIVLHLTRGSSDPEAIAAAVAALREIPADSLPAGPILLYHAVATEAPHRSLAYMSDDAELATAALKQLFDLTSPLLGRERLSVDKPAVVTANSRGFVLNGTFDLLLDGLLDLIQDANPQRDQTI